MEQTKKVVEQQTQITPPNFQTVALKIEGLAPIVQLRMSEKAKNMMMGNMSGQKAKRGKARPARDFDDDYKQSHYETADGKLGFPASAFRKGMISACRVANFKMTLAKLSLFVEADGFDKFDGTPLVFINGIPEKHVAPVRNATGVMDIRVRTMWRKWTMMLRVRFDADQFNVEDIANLLARVGMQVGIGEGRADSKNSAGCDWGFFSLVSEAKKKTKIGEAA